MGCTLACLIDVQDILIIFGQFSSQDILIRSRTFINFEKYLSRTNSKVYFSKFSNLLLNKKLELKFKLVHLFLPGQLLSPGCLLISEKFPSRMLIRPRTFIRHTRVVCLKFIQMPSSKEWKMASH